MAQKPITPGGTTPSGKNGAHTRSFLQDDFPLIRTSSLTLCACVALGAAMVGASAFLLNKQVNARNQAQPLYNQVREKYTQADNEKHEINDFQPLYKQLVASGFIGRERRLDWMESIKRIQERRNLLPIQYQISPQTPFQVDPALETETLELHGSKMLLKMDLLHEMDLLNFLDDLQKEKTYGLHDCNIKRLNVNPQDPLAAHLHAECTLYWITLGKRPTAEGEAQPASAAEDESQ